MCGVCVRVCAWVLVVWQDALPPRSYMYLPCTSISGGRGRGRVVGVGMGVGVGRERDFR